MLAMFTMTDWRFLSCCTGKPIHNDIGHCRWMVLESRSVSMVYTLLLFNHYYIKKYNFILITKSTSDSFNATNVLLINQRMLRSTCSVKWIASTDKESLESLRINIPNRQRCPMAVLRTINWAEYCKDYLIIVQKLVLDVLWIIKWASLYLISTEHF